MKLDTFSEIRKLVLTYSPETPFRQALMNFYHIPAEQSEYWPLHALRTRFDHEEYRELAPASAFFEEHIQDICEHLDQYEDIYSNYFEDEVSRRIFCQILSAKLTLDIDALRCAYGTKHTHYFDPQLVQIDTNAVYVDCGGYIGDTVISFIQHCPEYKTIYVYEAAPDIMTRCKANLDDFSSDDSIVFREAAVFSAESRLKFSMKNGNGDSALSDVGELSVDAVSLDHDVTERISFIKMDIEGSEAEAILGAKEHIQKESPTMAICIYHRKDDFWKLPQLIREINPNYRFKICHHQPYQFYDTVLYCIPLERHEFIAKVANHNLCALGNMRSRLLLKKLRSFSEEELKDEQATIDSKTWCVKALRGYQDTLRNVELSMMEQKKWSEQLQEGKAYLEVQIQNRDDALAEIKAWTAQLEEGKAYLEGQVKNRDEALTEVKAWAAQLEEGKAYLEVQIQNRDEALTEVKAWAAQLEEGKAYLAGELSERDTDLADAKALGEEQLRQIAQLETEKSKLAFYLREEIKKPWYKKLVKKSKESDYNL